jgi:hypothetical protein
LGDFFAGNNRSEENAKKKENTGEEDEKLIKDRRENK